MLSLNIFSILFLVSAVVLFTLFFVLIQSKSKSKARGFYNWFILSAGFWMLSDVVEYSVNNSLIARVGLIFSYFFVSVALFFLARTIFELEGEKNDWISLIPFAFFILLAPSFEVKRSVFVLFNDFMNLPLLVFSFMELGFFLFLVFSLFSFRRKIKKKEVRKKLSYFAYCLLFIVVFNFFYYLLSVFDNLPPLTWFSAILFVVVTYPLFKG